jgi:O-methyltransferase involved in polyketide biosynthesis
VTFYLTREVNLSALRSFATCAVPGSELVFTYLHPDAISSEAVPEAWRSLRRYVATLGEPWLSGFDPRGLPDDLQRSGLELIEDLDGPEMLRRYGRAGANGWSLEAFCHIAHARVV